MKYHLVNITLTIIFLLTCLFYQGCGKSLKNHNGDVAEKSPAGNAGAGDVKVQEKAFYDMLEFQGKIEKNPRSLTDVCVPLGGHVKNLHFFPGDHVNKGDVLAEVSNPEYVLIQKEYHEIKSKLAYYQQDFKRQGELTIENAASIKKMQKAQADYRSMEASFLANVALLEFLGIEARNLDEDSIFSTIALSAPVSGYISKLNGHAGKFMEKEIPLYEITGYSRPLFRVLVKAENLHLVSRGDTLQVNLPGDTVRKGVIYKIVPDPEDDNSYKAYVHVNSREKWMPGLKFNAFFTMDTIHAWALPATIIQQHENENFVRVKRGTKYIKIPLTPGREQDGFVEIIQPDTRLLPGTASKN
jgi:cobalt-zinc-cadmium efflux system membrane fusion protein